MVGAILDLMELWFIMAIASAVGLGLYAFTPKVAAMRGYDATLFTCYANIAAAVFALAALFILSDLSGWANMILLFALGNGLLHTTGKIFRIDALRKIDTTLFFPLYKETGPLIIIVFAMCLFKETFTLLEWTGIFLSLFIPLLLITKAERATIELGQGSAAHVLHRTVHLVGGSR